MASWAALMVLYEFPETVLVLTEKSLEFFREMPNDFAAKSK
ncbi:hypothetical protein RESH_02851 [Rhodopirellula europaea SH398]|jgi:hypothetical protein|uniref:Uncharacterized protein n=1 Tax=Rhodopirellula europaea SH398 TaxID=1263868 RepID=M5S545_9BACT|nr:hypothetical protein RESH_02851 [Rhodopirellula europaea SH398]|tara:strand:+ start:673 stop:795 length:123 start_codon:yes stop_codon:yes gene_type:complete